MKILVTGGAGFIGSHLVDKLIENNNEVVVIDNLSTGDKKNLNPKIRLYKLDIQSPKVSDIFRKEKPETVFHFAAQIDLRKSVEMPLEDAKINILGALNILENCRKYSVKKIIFASTGGAIYGEANIIPTPESYPAFPLSPYGITKLAVEKYLNYYFKNFGLSYIALRLGNVYGPRQNSKGEAGVVAILCDKILLGRQPVIYGDGRQTRDFVYVDDVVKAGVLALDKNRIGVFNIGTAKENDINTIFSTLKQLTGSSCEETHEPAKPGEQRRSCLDCRKAIQELGWQPSYNLEKGLEQTVNWFKTKNK